VCPKYRRLLACNGISQYPARVGRFKTFYRYWNPTFLDLHLEYNRMLCSSTVVQAPAAARWNSVLPNRDGLFFWNPDAELNPLSLSTFLILDSTKVTGRRRATVRSPTEHSYSLTTKSWLIANGSDIYDRRVLSSSGSHSNDMLVIRIQAPKLQELRLLS